MERKEMKIIFYCELGFFEDLESLTQSIPFSFFFYQTTLDLKILLTPSPLSLLLNKL